MSTNFYESLVGWKANLNDGYAHQEPMLAESWNVSGDLKTYTFVLRKGIRWQNVAPVNGRELVAEDAVFSLNRYREPDSVWYQAYSSVESIEAPDKYTVVVRLKEPNAWAVNDLFQNIQWLVPPEFVKESKGDLGLRAIGTGPFILKSYAIRRSATMVRNPDYWSKDSKGNALPYLDSITEIFMTDPATGMAAMRTGQLDFPGVGLGTEQVISLGKSIPTLRVTSGGVPTRIGIAFNTKRLPWSDVKVRRALNMSLDKERIIESVVTIPHSWEWAGPLAWNLISDKALTFDDLGPYYKYNPAEAKKLLVEAGFPDGRLKVETPLIYGTGTYHVARVLVIKELLKAQGIDLDLSGADSGVYKDIYYNRSWQDLGLTFQNTGDLSLNWYAQNKFATGAIQNSSFVEAPEVQKVVRDIKTTSDTAKQRELAKFLWDFETLGSWVIWMPAEITYSAYAPRVRNNTARAGSGNWTGQRIDWWLADAPRTSP